MRGFNNISRKNSSSSGSAGCLFVFLLPFLLPLSYCSLLFSNQITYEEHYERAEIARRNWQEQIKKDLIISNIQILKNAMDEAEINYTLTNSSNRDICSGF